MNKQYKLIDDSFSYYLASLIIVISLTWLNFPNTFFTLIANIFGLSIGSITTVMLGITSIIAFNKYASSWINNTEDIS